MACIYKLKFTISDLAAAVGRHPETVREDARAGLWSRDDLESVVRYVAGYQSKVNPETWQAYLALGLALKADQASLSPGPKEPIMLLHSIHRRKKKESLIPPTVPTGSGVPPQSV